MDEIWDLNGCHLNLTLPSYLIDPVIEFVDQFVFATQAEDGSIVKLTRASVYRHEHEVCLSYELPSYLFGLRKSKIDVDITLVEDGGASFTFLPHRKNGQIIEVSSKNETAGAVDYFDGENIKGWSAPRNDGKVDQVGVFLDNELFRIVSADELRRDIKRKQGGSGLCGFQCALPDTLFDGMAHVLCCAEMQSLRPLRNGLFRVDRNEIERRLMNLIRSRVERLDRFLE